MKIETAVLETQSLNGFEEGPSLSGAQVMPDGSLVVGSSFGHPLLRKIVWKKGEKLEAVVDLKLEREMGEDALAVVGGFKESEKGDVDLVVLHDGSFPTFLRSMMGKIFAKKSGAELVDFLDRQNGSMGAQCSHLQYSDGKYRVRRYKEPGMTWDIHFLGDYVFGLFPNQMWREPYLHLAIEKREALRNGLSGNKKLHRSEDGTFWAKDQNGRLMRFQYTENKAKPTLLKVPSKEDSQDFELSAASKVDGWLYGVSGGGKTLFRVRRNPISFEEEIQKLWDAPEAISAICAWDSAENPKIVLATASESGASLYSFKIEKLEDEEMIPEVPEATLLTKMTEAKRVSALTPDLQNACLWAVEGYFGVKMARSDKEKLRVLRITEL